MMKTKYFYLGSSKDSKLVKIFRIIFGLTCLVVAVFWMVFNIKSLETNKTLWITIIFLLGFGFYQIWSGLGRAIMFIEIGPDYIRLKRNPVLPYVEMNVKEIERIEIFPLNIIFYTRQGRKIFFRFGTTYTDNIEPIKNTIISFAEDNNILSELKIEEF